MEFAEFLEEMGLGERSELEKILLDTGLRQRGIGELVRAPHNMDYLPTRWP